MRKGMFLVCLGSVAKGYAGDRVLALFREKGVSSALLNLGGNVQTLGAKPDGSPWRIAVQDPDGEDSLGVLAVEDKAEDFWRAHRDFDLVLLTDDGRLPLTPDLVERFQLREGRTETVEVIEA